jgi:hypothetical protein
LGIDGSVVVVVVLAGAPAETRERVIARESMRTVMSGRLTHTKVSR